MLLDQQGWSTLLEQLEMGEWQAVPHVVMTSQLSCLTNGGPGRAQAEPGG